MNQEAFNGFVEASWNRQAPIVPFLKEFANKSGIERNTIIF